MLAGAVLQHALVAAREERTLQRVLLAGAEGLGRTHLLAALRDCTVLRADLSRGTLVAQTIRALLGESGDDEATWQALASSRHLEGLDLERAQIAVELLASLLGIRRADARTARLDEDSRREGGLLELARWLAEVAHQQGGVVLAIDDAHLADEEGAAFLELIHQRDEPAPLLLVVSHDAARERATPAFRARCDAWLSDARWQRVELTALPGDALTALLVEAGAPAALAGALAAHAHGNPGLAFGLWHDMTAGVSRPLSELPTTLDGLRLARVKGLGAEVLRACSTLAAVGGAAPLAALAAVHPEVPLALQSALKARVVRISREGQLDICRLIEPRLRVALQASLPQGQVLGAQLAAGVWAVTALEGLDVLAFARVAEVLVPLALPALDAATASLWAEALATSKPGRAEAVGWLDQAARVAVGARRLVLLRRIAEVKLFLGLPDEALAVIATAGRVTAVGPQALPEGAVGRVLDSQARGVLDCWETLALDEAQVALELVRAECVSFLVKKEDTEKAFELLEQRLLRLSGPVAAHLLIRWAKGWSWFLCEILGRAPDALKVCALVREQVSAEVLAADEDAIAFVRAEEVAATSNAEFTRARVLTEEHIALAERAGRLRDACLGWNARGIVHYGQGELHEARKALEQSLALARTTGWLRREAITLHNLSLVLTELGELDEAEVAEKTFERLSVVVGNHAGKAEAPLVLANIELARGRLTRADQLLAVARKVADQNYWDMLMTWSRALMGRLRLLRYLAGGDPLEITKARNDLMAALEVFEERRVAWSEELDASEVLANYILALKWSGQLSAAREVIEAAKANVPREAVVSLRQLEVASALVEGVPLGPSLAWFEARGFKRRVEFWHRAEVGRG